MPPNGKKQLLPPPDVVSNLPDSVIDEILMRLPLRDAVRTSILSKKWRCNWCRLPQLTLDRTLWKTTDDLMSPTIGFTNIVHHFLTLHTGQISKFILDIHDLETCPKINNLISFLSRNDIQHLVVQLPFTSKPYKLHSSIFTCSQLRHLVLAHCLIRPPLLFKGFDRLISLELIEVTISSELVGSLISHCPLLEHLVLEQHKQDDVSGHIEISAPKLRSFFFIGECDLTKIFESIPALENLCWNQDHVKDDYVGQAEVIPTRLPSALNCLKRLCLSWSILEEFSVLSFALCLIRSSPNLEEIEIEVCVLKDEIYYEVVRRDAVDEIPASFSNMTFNHLRTVKIYNVAGTKAEMQLIKVLLAKSPALVRMLIKPCRMEDRKSLKVVAEITNFPRASSKAQVVYNVD